MIRQKNLDQASDLAWQTLAQRDFGAVCESCGAERIGEAALRVAFFGRTAAVWAAERRIEFEEGPEISKRVSVLILHYLCTGGGKHPAGQVVGFAEIPGASGYLAPFRGRTAERLKRRFGADPERMAAPAAALGAARAEYGDVSYTFPAFPRVPVSVVIWKGDEELPPEAKFLFDASIAGYLSVEDVVVLCEELTIALLRKPE